MCNNILNKTTVKTILKPMLPKLMGLVVMFKINNDYPSMEKV